MHSCVTVICYLDVLCCPIVPIFPCVIDLCPLHRAFWEKRRLVTTPDLQSSCKKEASTNSWQRRS